MALLQVNYVSQALMRTVTLHVVLPVDKFDSETSPYHPERKFPTLYLLHGVFGNYTDWVSGTRVQRWAEAHDLAVVMPSGDNRFYVDQPAAHDLYGEFIGRELVEITRRMFPLSRRREDTFVGGLSMGGFGALRNGPEILPHLRVYCCLVGRQRGGDTGSVHRGFAQFSAAQKLSGIAVRPGGAGPGQRL